MTTAADYEPSSYAMTGEEWVLIVCALAFAVVVLSFLHWLFGGGD